MLYEAFDEAASTYTDLKALGGINGLTYRELSAEVIEWSFVFETGPRTSTLIILPRIKWLPIIQLAVNRANGIFACADVSWPTARIQEIIRQLEPRWICSMGGEFLGYEQRLTKEGVTIFERVSASKQLEAPISHVCFSSGSTGAPKGIYLHAEGLIHVVKEQAARLKIGPNTRVFCGLSPAFDASLSDMYTTLLTGGTLYLYESELTRVKTLMRFLKEHKISHADLPPSLLTVIDPIQLPHLEGVIFGGELSNEASVKKWAKEKAVWNAYGPTEASVCCAMRRVDECWESEDVGELLPGFNGMLVEDGELWLAGDMLCVKYHQEVLNQTKFVEMDGVRYYKTGDLFEKRGAFWHYRGRKDRQLKWNGVLISPEEVEAAARKAGCSQARFTHEKKMQVYYVGNMTPSELRMKLEKLLPSNMMPHELIKKELSLKTNGKSDV
jgi:acyl-coenzyme A synthetase/AMP-(fatty) acid ligase